ncbi:hypothetical protein KAW18_02360 [candidate division WOR-3 bacterium]|nr:hypothetical protein [candidate division WOR-3 bacterium]
MKKKLILNVVILILFFLIIPCSAIDIPVTFNVSSTVSIGEIFIIQGYVNTTGTVDVSLEDKLYPALNNIPINDKNFSKEIDTSEYAEFQSTGYLILRAYVNRDLSTDIELGEINDGMIGIVLTGGSLTAKTSTTIVSPGSDFTISGIAKGTKTVDVLIIPPDGNYGSCIEDGATTINSTSIYYKSPIVSNDNTYSLDVVTDEKIDTGSYFVMVLTKGDDNRYGKGHDDLTAALSSRRFTNKLQDQIIDIIEDATYGAVASDDFYWTSYVKVASESVVSVVLDSIQDVVVGNSLKVTGTSSKEDGHSVIVMVVGQTVFQPQTAKVTSNRFSATFSTANAIVGSYTIEADDGDGHTDELIIEIVSKPVVTPTKVATPIPTEEVTPKPTEVKPTAKPEVKPTSMPTLREVPGVGIMFTFLSLLIVGYLFRYRGENT